MSSCEPQESFSYHHNGHWVTIPSLLLTSSTIGFSAELDEQLVQQANSQMLEDYQRHVIIVADEMHIKEDLVYDKFTGELVGFCNLGEINQQLHQLEVAATGAEVNLMKQ